MKMKFDVDNAIDNAIDIFYKLEDFYRTYNGPHLASIKAADGFFINVENGSIDIEFNKECEDESNDETFISHICDVRNCDKTEEEIRIQIRTFLTDIPPTGNDFEC